MLDILSALTDCSNAEYILSHLIDILSNSLIDLENNPLNLTSLEKALSKFASAGWKYLLGRRMLVLIQDEISKERIITAGNILKICIEKMKIFYIYGDDIVAPIRSLRRLVRHCIETYRIISIVDQCISWLDEISCRARIYNLDELYDIFNLLVCCNSCADQKKISNAIINHFYSICARGQAESKEDSGNSISNKRILSSDDSDSDIEDWSEGYQQKAALISLRVLKEIEDDFEKGVLLRVCSSYPNNGNVSIRALTLALTFEKCSNLDYHFINTQLQFMLENIQQQGNVN